MQVRYILILLGLFTLHGCGKQKHIIYPASKIKPLPNNTPELNDEIKNQYLTAVNSLRVQSRQCGTRFYPAAKPLQWNQTLYSASYEHSKDMAICSHFSHNGSGTQSDWTAKTQNLGKCSNFVSRIENNGYLRHRGLSENIAYGATSAEEVMQQLINSEGHCKNIMNPKYIEFGMAKFVSEDGGYYWTQSFGTRQ